MSIGRRYAFQVCGLLILLLAAKGGVDAYFQFQSSRQAIANVQRAVAGATVAKVDAQLTVIASTLRDLSRLRVGVDAVDVAAKRVEYLRVLKLNPSLLDLRRIDASSRETLFVSRTEPDRVDGNAEFKDSLSYFPSLVQGVEISNAYQLDAGDRYVTLRTIMGAAGDGGRVVARMNLRAITSVISSAPRADRATAFLVDASGQLVAHPNASLVFGGASLTDYAFYRSARDRLVSEGSTTAFRTRGLSSSSSMISAVPVGGSGWIVFIEQPMTVALAPVWVSLGYTGFLLAIAIAVSIPIASVFSFRLTRPIVALKAGAERMGRGDLTARLAIHTNDEVEDLANEFNSMAAQLEDYTKGLEQKVAEKTRELSAANQHKSEFLANMSHELRTPLNAVIGFSDALKEQYFGPLNEKQIEYVQGINASGQLLLSLINDILDLSKIEAGKMELEASEFSVAAAVENALILVRERAIRQELRLTASVAEDVGTIVADERKFKQILINLLTNAVKFSYPGGWVRVDAIRANMGVEVSVADSGIGIAPEDQASVFEEFKQLAASGSAKHEGTGLGLSLVKRLVELHGGTVRVESEVGKGAKFIVWLPACSPNDVGVRVDGGGVGKA